MNLLSREIKCSLNVGKLSGNDSDGSTAKDAAEEAEDEESGPVGRQRATQRPYGEQEKGRDAEVSTADMFAKWPPCGDGKLRDRERKRFESNVLCRWHRLTE